MPLRAGALVLLLFVGLGLGALLAIEGGRRLPRERLAQWWHRRLLAVLNVKVRVAGQLPDRPALIVANHVSWLDISVIGALALTRFVSKAEVRDWPVAGQLADACGTFYLRRGKGGSGPLLDQLIPHLRRGGSATLFPEGTTTDGLTVKPFHARLFAAATESGCAVQPLALRYGSRVAPFIGEDDLVSHVRRVLREPEIVVDAVFCPALAAAGADRDELAQAAACSIRRVVHAMAIEARSGGDIAADLTPA